MVHSLYLKQETLKRDLNVFSTNKLIILLIFIIIVILHYQLK